MAEYHQFEFIIFYKERYQWNYTQTDKFNWILECCGLGCVECVVEEENGRFRQESMQEYL